MHCVKIADTVAVVDVPCERDLKARLLVPSQCPCPCPLQSPSFITGQWWRTIWRIVIVSKRARCTESHWCAWPVVLICFCICCVVRFYMWNFLPHFSREPPFYTESAKMAIGTGNLANLHGVAEWISPPPLPLQYSAANTKTKISSVLVSIATSSIGLVTMDFDESRGDLEASQSQAS